MNLSMQTRRAMITLSLAAMAMAFVMAKASTGAGAQARMSAAEPVRAETVSVAREKFAAPTFVVAVHVSAPTLVAAERAARKTARTRCEVSSAI